MKENFTSLELCDEYLTIMRKNRHKYLVNEIDKIIKMIKDYNICDPDNFFIEDIFKNQAGGEYRCYKITKKGKFLLFFTLKKNQKIMKKRIEFINNMI